MNHTLRACLCTVSTAEQGSSKLPFVLFKNKLSVFSFPLTGGGGGVRREGERQASSTFFNNKLRILKFKLI